MDLPSSRRTLPGLVHVADILAGRLRIGFCRDVEHTDIDPILLGHLDIKPEQVGEQLPEALEEATAIFGGP